VSHRDDGKRFVVHADEKLTAFLELESAVREASGKLLKELFVEGRAILRFSIEPAKIFRDCTALDRGGRTIWIADAHCSDGKR
jgi:hypothetical protein